MAGGDFLVNVLGKVSGFDMAPINNFNNALKTAGPTASQVASQVNAATNTMGTSFTTAGAKAQQFGTTMAGVANPVNTVAGAFTGAGTRAQTFTGALNQLNPAATAVRGGLTSTNTVLGQTGVVATTTAGATTSLGTALTTSVGGFAAVIGSGVALFQVYDQLTDAQFNVQKATNALTKIQLMETTLQNKLNKLTSEGKTGTAEYAVVQQKLALAHSRAEVAMNNVGNAQENLNIATANFASTVVPLVISGVGGVTTILTNMKGVFPSIVAGFASLGSSTGIFTKMKGAVDLLFGGLGNLGGGFNNTASAAGNATRAIAGTTAATDAANLSSIGLVGRLGVLAAAIAGVVAAAQISAKVGFDNNAIWDQTGETIGKLHPELAKALTGFKNWALGVEVGTKNLGGLNAIFPKTNSELVFEAEQAKKAAEANKVHAEAVKSSEEVLGKLGVAMLNTNTGFTNLGNGLVVTGGKFMQVGQGAKTLEKLMTDAMTNINSAVDQDKVKILQWGLAHGKSIELAGLSAEQIHKLAAVYGALGSAEDKELSSAAQWLVEHNKVGLVSQIGIDAAMKYAAAQVKLEEAHKKTTERRGSQ